MAGKRQDGSEPSGVDAEITVDGSGLSAAEGAPSPQVDDAAQMRTSADLGNQVDDASSEQERIDRYTLIRELGEGGMGTVWLAQQREPVERLVALKVIKLGMDTREVISRFQAERQALAMMNHSGIASVLDAGATEQGRPYFVMEYVPGEPITEYCDRHRLTVRERLLLFSQVCAAVQHAHQKGIIHRDLKPSNVLVSEDEGIATPKIIDFGLVKAMDERIGGATMQTRHGAILGTPAYMSPEQVDPLSVDIDTRADIYSLGVLLYELLVGGLPFSDERARQGGISALFEMIRSEEPPRLTRGLSTLGPGAEQSAIRRGALLPALVSQLRGDLEWIVARAMDKDRDRRYGSASELADDIRRHLSDEPVEARPASNLYRMQKLIRRRRGAVLAASAVLVALLAGLATTTVMYVRAEERRVQAERDRELAEGMNDFATLELLGTASRMPSGVTMLEVVEAVKEKIVGRFPTRPVTEARLQGAIGLIYERHGDPAMAEEHYRAGLELTDDPDDCGDSLPSGCDEWAAWGHGALGKLLSERGEWAEARLHQEQGVAAARRLLGPENPTTLVFTDALAVTMTGQGDLIAARALQEELVAAWAGIHGTEHVRTTGAMWSLLRTLRALGADDDASHLTRQLCWILERDPATLDPEQRVLGGEVSAECQAGLAEDRNGSGPADQ